MSRIRFMDACIVYPSQAKLTCMQYNDRKVLAVTLTWRHTAPHAFLPMQSNALCVCTWTAAST
eukprot:1141491-Pelagomonas_calceolata.AAC.3